jgi:sulfide:quinone oxidoreductase
VTRTLILGGGFGGVATAVELRALLPQGHEIVVVDRRDTFFMGLRKLWLMAGIEPLAPGTRRMDALKGKGITVIRGEVARIEPGAPPGGGERPVVAGRPPGHCAGL